MNFAKTLISLLVLISVNCFSQNKDSLDIRDITKVTFLDPGISYEKRIGKFQSLQAQLYMSPTIGFLVSSTFNYSALRLDPAINLQYRYYYNVAKRHAKGKRTEMNSSNYVGLLSDISFSKDGYLSTYYGDKTLHPLYAFGIVWGLQRNYKKRFSLDLNVGPGYLYRRFVKVNNADQFVFSYSGQFSTVGQLKLGFWLNKRK